MNGYPSLTMRDCMSMQLGCEMEPRVMKMPSRSILISALGLKCLANIHALVESSPGDSKEKAEVLEQLAPLSKADNVHYIGEATSLRRLEAAKAALKGSDLWWADAVSAMISDVYYDIALRNLE